MEDKLISSQKYFLFKLPDILNNAFHTFEEKRAESLQLILCLCLDTYEEMNQTSIGMDKLLKSYKALLHALAFQIRKHPFVNLKVYTQDFEQLCKLIGPMENDAAKPSYELYLAMKSLLKKLKEDDLTKRYVECLQGNMLFAAVDNLIEALVSDLLYMGYSLNYLNEWYVANMRDDSFYTAIQNNDTGSLINRLTELDGEQKEYEVIIPYQVRSVSQQQSAKQLLEKNFKIFDRSERAELTAVAGWKEENFACKTVSAADHYKAIESVKTQFSTDKELFCMWQGGSDVIRENVKLGCLTGGRIITVDIRKADNTKLISYIDTNRVEQLNTFIELKDRMKNEDVDTLERILHTLHIAKSYNIQNRYLNFWSALEYALYPFPRNSIIEKARTVVPEAFALFYIKNKMNVFWERLLYTMGKKDAATEHPECKLFIDECRGIKDFDTQKVIAYLQDEVKCQKLVSSMEFHVVLKREIMELVMLVTDPVKLKAAVETYHDEIVHDLDCVYRLRNGLIHSAKGQDDSLEHISLRLYRYVNSIVSTILYYKKKNADVSIVEILNSLHSTYNAYMEKMRELELKDKKNKSEDKQKPSLEEGYSFVRPKYLFLE